MVEFAGGVARSWLDEAYARHLAYQLGDRLVRACQGHNCVLLTLTYAREPYRDARECYRRQQDEQHLPLFFRRLARSLGKDLAGNWFAKVEFQKDGFIHFHCVVRGVKFIRHDVLTRAWGHGHCWINAANKSRLRYACKYVSKDAPVPTWLLNENRVRIVRVSNGFWGSESREARHYEPRTWLYRFAFIPIGRRLENARNRVLVREERTDGGHNCVATDVRYFHVHIPLGRLCALLVEAGVQMVEGTHSGWLCIDVDREAFERVLTRSGGGEAAAGLHLKDCCKDDLDTFDLQTLGEELGWWLP